MRGAGFLRSRTGVFRIGRGNPGRSHLMTCFGVLSHPRMGARAPEGNKMQKVPRFRMGSDDGVRGGCFRR